MGLFVPACFLGLLIPDGHLPSRRWRPVAWCAAITVGCGVIGTILGESQVNDGHTPNPFHVPHADNLFILGTALLLPVIGLGITAAVVRYRQGTQIERQQMKWIIAAFVAIIVTGILQSSLLGQIWFVTWALLPIAFAVSILRYRLYEIDVIIRKTLIYAALAATLALVYLGGISLTTWIFRSVTGQSGALAVTLSTLIVAAVFQPLRTRIQRTVDHRFYRRKYDATRALDAFNHRMREQIDLDALHDEVLGVITETLQPSHTTLWLRPTRPRS